MAKKKVEETIINTPAPKLNVAPHTALHSIAASSKQLYCFVEGTFTTRNLAPNDIKQIVDEVNKISHKAFREEKELIGRVYEYFLKKFAVNATKEEGEFYTPISILWRKPRAPCPLCSCVSLRIQILS